MFFSIKNNNFGKLGVQIIIQRKIIYRIKKIVFFLVFFLQKSSSNTLVVVYYSQVRSTLLELLACLLFQTWASSTLFQKTGVEQARHSNRRTMDLSVSTTVF